MSCLPLQENLPGCIIHLMDHLDDTTVDFANPVLSKVYQAVWSGTNLPEWPLYSVFHTKKYELSIKNGCLLWKSWVIIPHNLRQQVLKEPRQCYLGMVKNEALAWNYVWWPGIDGYIEEKVYCCYTCQSSRTSPVRALLHPWEWLREPWHQMLITTAEICS